MHVPGLLPPTPTPDLAQAGSSLAFFPEAWLSEGMCQSSSQGPRLCQEDTSPGPRGSREGQEPSRPQGLPCAHSPTLCLWQALPKNHSLAAAGWVLAEKPGQAEVSAALLALAEDQNRPALRAQLCQP